MSRRERQHDHPMRLVWIIGLSLYALMFGGQIQRVNPGGPFISISADVLPVVAAVAAIWLGVLTFRGRVLSIKLVSFFFMVLAAVAISNVTIGIYSFWIGRRSRGEFIVF